MYAMSLGIKTRLMLANVSNTTLSGWAPATGRGKVVMTLRNAIAATELVLDCVRRLASLSKIVPMMAEFILATRGAKLQ
jgi:hypothetical protein